MIYRASVSYAEDPESNMVEYGTIEELKQLPGFTWINQISGLIGGNISENWELRFVDYDNLVSLRITPSEVWRI